MFPPKAIWPGFQWPAFFGERRMRRESRRVQRPGAILFGHLACLPHLTNALQLLLLQLELLL
jgi:hypothetical protein